MCERRERKVERLTGSNSYKDWQREKDRKSIRERKKKVEGEDV